MKCLRYFLPVFFFLSVTMVSLSVGKTGNLQESFVLPEVAGQIVRTLIYHDVTVLSPKSVDRLYPLISGDGNRLVDSVLGTDGRNHVYVANFDGSETREVDSADNGQGVDISL